MKGYAGVKAREEKIPKSGGSELRLPESLDRLVQLYLALERKDEAARWQRERAKYDNPRAPMPWEEK
jgi:hypothetical protein